MYVSLLILLVSANLGRGDAKPFVASEQFQNDFLQMFNAPLEPQPFSRVCPTKEPESLQEEREYNFGPLEVNQCQISELKTNEQQCGDFDISVCGETCYLGYETDLDGCVVSCRCNLFGLFDSDIIMTDKDMRMHFDPRARGASKRRKRWNNIPQPDGTYTVPYTFHPSIGTPSFKANRIMAAIHDFETLTCLRFRPRGTENDYVEFSDGEGCKSAVGRQGGKQTIYIGYGCGIKGIIIHEMMHALGFFHEHNRPDRNRHVTVLWRNIKTKSWYNFIKLPKTAIDSMGSPYDLNSVLHYDGMSLSKNGRPTLLNAKNNKPVKAQRTGFSQEDIKQINMMYKCTRYLMDETM